MKTVKQALTNKSEELEKVQRTIQLVTDTALMHQQLSALRERDAKNLSKKVDNTAQQLEELQRRHQQQLEVLAQVRAATASHEQIMRQHQQAHEDVVQRLKNQKKDMSLQLTQKNEELTKLEQNTQEKRQILQGQLQDVLEQHDKDMKGRKEKVTVAKGQVERLQLVVMQKRYELKVQQDRLHVMAKKASAAKLAQKLSEEEAGTNSFLNLNCYQI